MLWVRYAHLRLLVRPDTKFVALNERKNPRRPEVGGTCTSGWSRLVQIWRIWRSFRTVCKAQGEKKASQKRCKLEFGFIHWQRIRVNNLNTLPRKRKPNIFSVIVFKRIPRDQTRKLNMKLLITNTADYNNLVLSRTKVFSHFFAFLIYKASSPPQKRPILF